MRMLDDGSTVDVVSVTYAEDTPVAIRYRSLAQEEDIADVLEGGEQGFMDTRPVYTARREARIDRDEREGWVVTKPDAGFAPDAQRWLVMVRDGYDSEEELAERLYAETPGTRRSGDWLDALLQEDLDDIL